MREFRTKDGIVESTDQFRQFHVIVIHEIQSEYLQILNNRKNI